jgi:2-iminobutanoate/2-iminopropanoate deaminase
MKRLAIFTCGFICCAVLFSAQGSANPRSFKVKREIIRTTDAPIQSTLYSQAVKVGSTIYVTGILGVDPRTNQPAGPTIQDQTRQALINCEAILRAAGATRDNVVEVQVLLARPDDFAGLNEEYAKFFTRDPPTRTVARLGPELPGLLVSIRMTAVL